MAGTHHAEWLSLLDISGPFLSPPVLDRVFPQGLGMVDSDQSAKLRLAHQEWAEEQQRSQPDPAIHDRWIRFVLTEALEFTPEILVEGDGVPTALTFAALEHGESISPSFAILGPESEDETPQVQLLVAVYRPGQGLDTPVAGSSWIASPSDRMVQMCRNGEVRLGLVTNGEQWMLVDSPVGETPGFASWYAELWTQEPLTLRAFQSLLGMRRFFAAVPTDRLEAMLIDSANFQTEVTGQLGLQVRRAVEVLVQAIDQADQDSGRTLLRDLDESRLYEAALTVMMRLVFLFSAEERGLLLLGDPTYDQHYAVSTLSAQLREAADLVSEEVLESRQDAWSRLLATFRAIFDGVHHESLPIVPYGSSLFDPDRFPFLEGRPSGTTWRQTDAAPIPIDNRTVLLLLESLQFLNVANGNGARKLSFRALDIEQIGHVYETLLDHTAQRASEPMLSLQGNQGMEPEIAVSSLHKLLLHENEDDLVGFLTNETKRSALAIRSALAKRPLPEVVARLRAACGDDELLAKVLPFHELIRLDPWGNPVVVHEAAVFVTASAERRSTGTHYTPRALTEEIVQYALEPLVYRGPAEGKAREGWNLKSPVEILELKVCDPAMGSGAFLVQACRYLSERLVESWEQFGHDGLIDLADGHPSLDHATSTDQAERLIDARRLVADRCLYGVDVNPLAVEMAKLSMWLITLAKGTAFSFLDHALKCGDSLLGVNDLDQIRNFNPDPDRGKQINNNFFDPTQQIDAVINKALQLRKELQTFTVRDITDAQRKRQMYDHVSNATSDVVLLGDLVTGIAIGGSEQPNAVVEKRLSSAGALVAEWLCAPQAELRSELIHLAEQSLNNGKPPKRSSRQPFHWPVEFPEVFLRSACGFDAVLSNPPFLGGTKISGILGYDYNAYLGRMFPPFSRRVDLCALFFRRGAALLQPEGQFGMLATSSIAEHQTRRGGLDVLLLEGFVIHRSWKSFLWPGSASVMASKVWMSCAWTGSVVCEGATCARIGSDLEPSLSDRGRPRRLKEQSSKCFQGSRVWGEGRGFYLTQDEAKQYLAEDPRAREVVKPCMNGQDLNNTPTLTPSKWIIDFDDMSEEEAQNYFAPFKHLEATIKAWRQTLDVVRYPRIVNGWWKYFHPRLGLYRGISRLGLPRVLVRARVSDHHMMAFVSSDMVYMDKLIVVLADDWYTFGVLQSPIHDIWLRKYGTTLGTTMTYIPAECYETFPMPEPVLDHLKSIETQAKQFYSIREQVMIGSGAGLTTVHNRMHDSGDQSSDINDMRLSLQQLTNEVARSYGWDQPKPVLAFRESSLGVRFTVSEGIRNELIERLLTLNHSRSAIESDRALGGPKTSVAPITQSTGSVPQDQPLFE